MDSADAILLIFLVFWWGRHLLTRPGPRTGHADREETPPFCRASPRGPRIRQPCVRLRTQGVLPFLSQVIRVAALFYGVLLLPPAVLRDGRIASSLRLSRRTLVLSIIRCDRALRSLTGASFELPTLYEPDEQRGRGQPWRVGVVSA